MEKYYNTNNNFRSGLRLKFDSDVHCEVRQACKEFCKWLRSEYYFPIRVPVYIKSVERIKALDGDLVCATFFEPFNRDVEPYIKVATGYYNDLIKKFGKDKAVLSIIRPIEHELTHYFQWVNDIKLTIIGEERQASAYANFIMDEYGEHLSLRVN